MMNIIKHKKIPFIFSGLLVGASVAALIVFGLKPGIDFTGGSLIEVRFEGDRPTVAQMQEAMAALNFGSALIQPSDDDGMILKLRFVTEEEHQKILASLREKFETDDAKVFEERIDTIGPAVSSQLKSRSLWASIAVAVAIILYIAYTFRRVTRPVASWKYGVAAVIALLHDVIITMGVFAVLGKYLGVEADITFVVALLIIFGYSVNDTIVVFDRVRENLIKEGPDQFAETVNHGVNQTFMRSLNTSLTVLLILASLFLLGGESIRYFSLALIIGITFGTYSSIFVASALLVAWDDWDKRKLRA